MEQSFLPRMISLRRVASVAFAALAVASASLQYARAETVDQLYEAAKAEGKLVYWSANDADALRIMSPISPKLEACSSTIERTPFRASAAATPPMPPRLSRSVAYGSSRRTLLDSIMRIVLRIASGYMRM